MRELLFGGDAPDDDVHLESARQQAELSPRVVAERVAHGEAAARSTAAAAKESRFT